MAGAPEPEPADFINHSCDPNCVLSGNVVLVARRDIAVGEELGLRLRHHRRQRLRRVRMRLRHRPVPRQDLRSRLDVARAAAALPRLVQPVSRQAHRRLGAASAPSAAPSPSRGHSRRAAKAPGPGRAQYPRVMRVLIVGAGGVGLGAGHDLRQARRLRAHRRGRRRPVAIGTGRDHSALRAGQRHPGRRLGSARRGRTGGDRGCRRDRQRLRSALQSTDLRSRIRGRVPLPRHGHAPVVATPDRPVSPDRRQPRGGPIRGQ